MSTENKNAQMQRPSSQDNKPKAESPFSLSENSRARKYSDSCDFSTETELRPFPGGGELQSQPRPFGKPRSWWSVTASCAEIYFSVWLGGVVLEVRLWVGLPPPSPARSDAASPSLGQEGKEVGGTGDGRRGILCSSARTGHFFLCKPTGYLAQRWFRTYTPCQHHEPWKADNGWSLWGFDFYFIGVVCAAHLRHNITFYWRWNASIRIPTNRVAYNKNKTLLGFRQNNWKSQFIRVLKPSTSWQLLFAGDSFWLWQQIITFLLSQ